MGAQSLCDFVAPGKGSAGGPNAQNWMRVRITVKDMLHVSKRFVVFVEEEARMGKAARRRIEKGVRIETL
jgi:hypothetical protein